MNMHVWAAAPLLFVPLKIGRLLFPSIPQPKMNIIMTIRGFVICNQVQLCL